jgi:hypothetical protein
MHRLWLSVQRYWNGIDFADIRVNTVVDDRISEPKTDRDAMVLRGIAWSMCGTSTIVVVEYDIEIVLLYFFYRGSINRGERISNRRLSVNI